MSYHHCPIEPSDWSDGNGDEGNCPDCEGTGIYVRSDDVEVDCRRCQGSGWIEEPYFDDDVI